MSESPEVRRAREIIYYTGSHLFLTGKAGTGKTTFLRSLAEDCPKRHVVLAPTGIAAINAGGVTIHSFFQYDFAPFCGKEAAAERVSKLTKQKIRLIRNIDLLVIDEISMVRADLLDHIDATLRRLRNPRKPFGGMQLLMIGDLQQLAPVAKDEEWALLSRYYETPFFFSSHALQQTDFLTIELQHVYRQQDTHFLALLNSVRENKADAAVLEELNKCYRPGFVPKKEDGYIRLVTHNRQAQEINVRELSLLMAEAITFKAEVEGTFPPTSFPTDEELTLKEGAQVMFVKNDAEHRYFNGSIGEVVQLSRQEVLVRLHADGNTIAVTQETWDNTRYALNESTKEIQEKVEGRFSQLPLKLAWAITIHKSQGLTFDRAIIDAHAAFSHGQTYVALSRCRTLEGLVLSTPIPPSAIINDQTVGKFTQEMTSRSITDDSIAGLRRKHFLELTEDLFDFSPLRILFASALRLMEEHFYRTFPRTLQAYREEQTRFDSDVMAVAARFKTQYTRLIEEAADYTKDTALDERIRKGARYFHDKLAPLGRFIVQNTPPTDNQELGKRRDEIFGNFIDAIGKQLQLLEYVANTGIDPLPYQKRRALILAGEKPPKEKRTKQKEKGSSAGAGTTTSEITHPELYKKLIRWRAARAKQEEIPVYVILQQRPLITIANLCPTTEAELLQISGIGKRTAQRFGHEILAIVQKYESEP